MHHLILALAFLISSTIFGQSRTETQQVSVGFNIEVSVVNALSDKGVIIFALYDNADFRGGSLQSVKAKVTDGVSSVRFEQIPNGIYAVLCFHDENENGRMDFAENGMPMEAYGATNNNMDFGPPVFDDAKFIIENENRSFEIKF